MKTNPPKPSVFLFSILLLSLCTLVVYALMVNAIVPRDDIASVDVTVPVDEHAAVSETASMAQSTHTLAYDINYAAVPTLTYQDLTLKVYVGAITSAEVTAGGDVVPSQYNATEGTLQFTVDSSPVIVTLTDPTNTTSIGQVAKTVLKDDKKWAWSMGFDDNVNLKTTFAMLESYGYRGTIYQIANVIDDVRNEPWIIDKPDMLTYLANGWSAGNHTWDHSCYQIGDRTAVITNGYNRIAQIASESSRPNYQVIGFAAPCFDAAYHPYILNMRDSGTSAVQFTESGSDYPLAVDPTITADFPLNERTVYAFNFDRMIARDARLEYDAPAAIAELDWIAARSSPTIHFWHNSLAHGGNLSTVQQVVDHVYDTYGAGGTDEVWVAPSDQIYSYLLVRDLAVVTLIGSSPGPVTQTAPLGNISGSTPTFIWQIEPSATEYTVGLYRVDTQQIVFMQTYNATICGINECTVQPSATELTLPPADYRWFIRASNSVGDGPWSLFTSPE